MGIKPGKKYHGTVSSGSELIQSQSGTLGYQVNLECEDGDTSFTIWLTPKNKERAKKTFLEALGVTEAQLNDGNYFEMELATRITGREVTFLTTEDEYKGKTSVKVSFLFPRSAVAGSSPGKAAASFFSGKQAALPDTPITDDDIPF